MQKMKTILIKDSIYSLSKHGHKKKKNTSKAYVLSAPNVRTGALVEYDKKKRWGGTFFIGKQMQSGPP